MAKVCRYCGREIKEGTICSRCENRADLVKVLIRECQNLKDRISQKKTKPVWQIVWKGNGYEVKTHT